MSESSKDANKDSADKSKKRFSSHGDSPVEMTPKDVSPKHASWKDRTERNTASKDEDERANALLDEASELSFPASDPIAVSSITKIVKDKDGKTHPAADKPKDR